MHAVDPQQATGEQDGGGGEGEVKRNSGGDETTMNRLESSRSSSFLGVKDFSLLDDDDDLGNAGKGGDEDCVVPQAAAVQGKTRI